MKTSETVWISALLVMLLFSPAMAQEPPPQETQPVEKLEDVVVTEKQSDQVPEYVQDVVPAQVLEEPSVSGSILDKLANQAGVQLQRSTLAGNNTGSLRIRGFGETRLRILSDGVSLQRDGSYGSGQVDWGAISPESIEGIEIHRGAGPAKFGNTLGGVVNIVSKEPTEEPKSDATFTAGSLGAWDARFNHSAKAGTGGQPVRKRRVSSQQFCRSQELQRQRYLRSARPFSGRRRSELLEHGYGVCGLQSARQPVLRSFGTIGGPGTMGFLLKGKYWGDESYAEDENTALTAFIAKVYDAGRAKIDFRLWNQERTEFYYDVENYITSTRLAGSSLSVYYNIGEVDIHGAEVEIATTLPFGLRCWANATWQEGEKDDDPLCGQAPVL